MGTNTEIEKEVIRQIASKVHSKDFIITCLGTLDDDKKREELIEYIQEHEGVGRVEIERKIVELMTGKTGGTGENE